MTETMSKIKRRLRRAEVAEKEAHAALLRAQAADQKKQTERRRNG